MITTTDIIKTTKYIYYNLTIRILNQFFSYVTALSPTNNMKR